MPVLDGENLIDAFGQHGLLHGTVGLRITPTGSFRFGKNEVRTKGVKFGITPEQLSGTIRQLKSYGVTKIGLHSYLSGNTLDQDYYPRLTELLLDLALDLSLEIQVEYINISGGIGLAYEPEDTPPDILLFGKSVQAVFEEKLTGTSLEQLGLYTELGRFVTGPSGMLITTVQHCKESCGKFAGVDASAADLMRPMLYGAYHHISAAGKEGASQRENWDVVGAVCENTDKFAVNRPLPPLEVGDVLAIHDAGAHGHSMGYNYGGRLRCGEYLLKSDGTTELLRRPETISDYLATQVF
jgi:diaminopimelate decarboxylase